MTADSLYNNERFQLVSQGVLTTMPPGPFIQCQPVSVLLCTIVSVLMAEFES